ncbi:MAG: dihydrodipicolinate synthase family protein [Phycisphaeraceae bacterium]
MPTPLRINGLVAATCTPLDPGGGLNLSVVPAYVDHLIDRGIRGLYVLGSTGEGVSMTSEERRDVAEAFIEAAQKRLPVIVQVGHDCLTEARALAEHAERSGADAVSAFAPPYFKCDSTTRLIDCMATIASGAPELPFYYYHMPAFTGVRPDLSQLLNAGAVAIPNLVGMKYTDEKVNEFQSCLESAEGRFEVLWGRDEMLLSGLGVGALGAVGSTYNIAPEIYLQLMDACERQDLKAARAWQLKAVRMIEVLLRFPIFASIKQVLAWNGIPLGPCRLPLPSLKRDQGLRLRHDLEEAGVLEFVLAADPSHVMPVKS